VLFAAARPPVGWLPSCGALPTGGCNSPDGSWCFSPFAMLPPAAPWPPAAGAPTHSDQLLQMAQFSACAAQREAERQLSLLQQLKCSLAASANPIESSCNSHHGALQQQRQGGDSLVSELQQQASPMPRTGGERTAVCCVDTWLASSLHQCGATAAVCRSIAKPAPFALPCSLCICGHHLARLCWVPAFAQAAGAAQPALGHRRRSGGRR